MVNGMKTYYIHVRKDWSYDITTNSYLYDEHSYTLGEFRTMNELSAIFFDRGIPINEFIEIARRLQKEKIISERNIDYLLELLKKRII